MQIMTSVCIQQTLPKLLVALEPGSLVEDLYFEIAKKCRTTQMQQEILPRVAIVGSHHLLIPSQDVSELAKKMYGEIQTFKRFLRLQHGKALIHSSSYRTGR